MASVNAANAATNTPAIQTPSYTLLQQQQQTVQQSLAAAPPAAAPPAATRRSPVRGQRATIPGPGASRSPSPGSPIGPSLTFPLHGSPLVSPAASRASSPSTNSRASTQPITATTSTTSSSNVSGVAIVNAARPSPMLHRVHRFIHFTLPVSVKDHEDAEKRGALLKRLNEIVTRYITSAFAEQLRPTSISVKNDGSRPGAYVVTLLFDLPAHLLSILLSSIDWQPLFTSHMVLNSLTMRGVHFGEMAPLTIPA
jgi:hypothetical protein